MKTLLVTGSSGLIGSAVCEFFLHQGWQVHGIDNNQRAVFFGSEGDTRWNQQRMSSQFDRFVHHEVDLRDRARLLQTLASLKPAAVVHAGAQPSHDLAARMPFDDFDTNAVGTLNMLEATRQACPESPFVLMSTNKVYGDRPNTLPLNELPTRYEYARPQDVKGISETMSIDGSMHSLFGVSKVAADVLTQEYGRYFNMPTCALRCGCLTGPAHSGVELHGFLSYLIRCNIQQRTYKIQGYKGKQVRDNLDASDVARFIAAFIHKPRSGEVYNLGGGADNTCSIIEAFDKIQRLSGKKQPSEYLDQPRMGDHICYYSDLSKAREHYPEWDVAVSLDQLFERIHQAWINRLETSNNRLP
jgi:CDP-paratose 2-epimerase